LRESRIDRINGLYRILERYFRARHPARRAALRAAAETNLKGAEYFGPNGLFEKLGNSVEVQPNALAGEESITRRLWEVSEQLTGVKFEFGKKANSVSK
jgi:hypothetical protein